MVTEQLYWRKILCGCFRFIWLWLPISISAQNDAHCNCIMLLKRSHQNWDAAIWESSIKNVFENCAKFTWKYICQSLFFTKVAGWSPATILTKGTPAKVLSKFGAIFQNTYSVEHLRTVALDCQFMANFKWRERKNYLRRQVCLEYWLASKLWFQLYTEKIKFTTKPYPNQKKKNCVCIFYFISLFGPLALYSALSVFQSVYL